MFYKDFIKGFYEKKSNLFIFKLKNLKLRLEFKFKTI